MTNMNLDNNEKPQKTDNKKRTINEITKELIEQLNDGPNDYFMALPMDEPFEPAKDNNTSDIIKHIQSFHIKPKEIKEYLDRFVISQMEAKKALAIAICDHYNFVKETINTGSTGHYTKQNILMIGPTGVGKTYLIKRIAELIGVPFVKSDATKFTETGYQGGDVEDLVRQLYKKANNNIELAEYGIIYLDEVDKITGTQSSHHKDVSGRGVQSNLLKIMEDTDVIIRPPWDIQGQIKQMMGSKNTNPHEKETINTKNILFIMSGAFNSLGDIVKKRLDGTSIGFERESNKKNTQNHDAYLKKLRTQDLVNFGLEPEFAGRLPVRVTLNELSPTDLYDILIKSEGSILEQYILSFKRFNIELAFNDDALYAIADQAHEERIGARALPSTLEKIFRDFKFELPSTSVRYIFATKNLIMNPNSALQNYLENEKKQRKVDIQSAINEKKAQLNQPFDTTKLIEKCLTEESNGKITEIIAAFFYKNNHHVNDH